MTCTNSYTQNLFIHVSDVNNGNTPKMCLENTRAFGEERERGERERGREERGLGLEVRAGKKRDREREERGERVVGQQVREGGRKKKERKKERSIQILQEQTAVCGSVWRWRTLHVSLYPGWLMFVIVNLQELILLHHKVIVQTTNCEDTCGGRRENAAASLPIYSSRIL